MVENWTDEEDLKVPSNEELSKDIKENPEKWLFSPKRTYTEEIELTGKVDITTTTGKK